MIDIHIKHPLQRFLDRNGISQSELARAVHISRETVNRWIRWRNLPVGENLIRTVEFARSFEARLEAHELFPTNVPPGLGANPSGIARSWGDECAVCGVPWSVETEHLPLALLHPEIGSHPVGGLCQTCARRTGTDPTVEPVEPDSEVRS